MKRDDQNIAARYAMPPAPPKPVAEPDNAQGSRSGELWTEAENAALIEAGDKGEDFAEVGIRLKRSRAACKVQYHALKRGDGRGVAKVASPNVRTVRQQHTALARQIRETLPQHQSLTAELLGDPLPGRSALDKMRAGQSQSGITLAMGPPS